jgi:Domain of unknown function (DUF5753)
VRRRCMWVAADECRGLGRAESSDTGKFLLSAPYLVVQVVPAANGANAGLGGAFDIAAADGMPDTLRMEGVEDQTIEKRSLVRKAAVAFDRVRADALPRAASHELILRLADELWKT